MRPVRPGDRGPAVEDIQRRLLLLGYDLGPTGIDGVFLGRTLDAVQSFQREHGLDDDGLVGDASWAALVDATFILGDRMLYLRLPHLHGHDVAVLQDALNVLGFACGATDAIFGSFTEGAVREFQRNSGLPADGIVGTETVRILMNLKHAWEGKAAGSHSAAQGLPARAADVLARNRVVLAPCDARAADLARRVVNLAHATTADAQTVLLGEDEAPDADAALVIRICADGTLDASFGRPVVRAEAVVSQALLPRLLTAFSAAASGRREALIDLHDLEVDERGDQRLAVLVLDAVCEAFV